MERATRVPPPLEKIVAQTQAKYVEPQTIIDLRQKLAHVTRKDLESGSNVTLIEHGVREVILAELAKRHFSGRINPQVLRLFAIKSPALAPVFERTLGELIREGIVLEHRRGYITVSLDPSQSGIMQKYAGKRDR